MTDEASVARFPATLTTPMKLVTYIVGYGVGVVLPAVLAVSLYVTSHRPWPFVLPLATITIFGVASLFRPLAFTVTRDELLVERPIGAVRIPLERIAAVTDAEEFFRGPTLGLFRVGGFYGTYGRFWNRGTGAFDLFLTGQPELLAIRSSSRRPLVISPTDPERFVDALGRRARERGLSFPISTPPASP